MRCPRVLVLASAHLSALALAAACSPPTGDGDADGDTDADADFDTDLDFDWDGICDEQDFDIAMEPVRVMILLDESSSMGSAIPWLPGSTHWEEATEGLRHMLDDPRNRDFYFGLDAFPDGTREYFERCYCAGLNPSCMLRLAPSCGRGCAVDLDPIVPMDRATVTGPQLIDYMSLSYLPGTFTSTPLLRQMQWYDTDRSGTMPGLYADDGASYLLVVSDGEDTCDAEGDPPDPTPVISGLATVTAHIRDTYGIRSVAVGFGDTSGSMADELNAIAENGGTVFTEFFAVTEPGALQAALDEISSEIVSCVYDIEEPDATADPTEVNFYFDGVVVHYDEDCTPGGWRWTAESRAEHPQIEFCGASCEELSGGEVEHIEARFGCTTEVW
jgi:hypothetical protein